MAACLPDAARFYAILDTSYVPRARWRTVAETLIAGSADLIQVRAKHASTDERQALVEEVLPLFRRHDVDGQFRPWLVINDDVELCARIPGTGLHIGQDDTPPGEARQRIGPDRLLGWSTHSPAQARAALNLPADVLSYFCVGPVFATPTKPDYVPVGLELVREVAGWHPGLPWFAIGGVKRANLRRVLTAGASRVVVVSEVLETPDPATVIREFQHVLRTGTRPGENR